jgi:hypothetical protein
LTPEWRIFRLLLQLLAQGVDFLSHFDNPILAIHHGPVEHFEFLGALVKDFICLSQRQ